MVAGGGGIVETFREVYFITHTHLYQCPNVRHEANVKNIHQLQLINEWYVGGSPQTTI